MGKLVQTKEMKVKDLLNKLIFNEKTPLSIFYVDKETNEEKEELAYDKLIRKIEEDIRSNYLYFFKKI